MDSYDFEINQGSTFSLNLNLNDALGNPIDLTNYTVSGYLKFLYSDSQKLTDLNATRIAPYASGQINISIADTGTAVLPITIARYDVEIRHTTSGTTDKVLKGAVTINPEVTY